MDSEGVRGKSSLKRHLDGDLEDVVKRGESQDLFYEKIKGITFTRAEGKNKQGDLLFFLNCKAF